MSDDHSKYRTLNPTTEELEKEFPCISDNDLGRAIDSATEAFADWHRRPLWDRLDVLDKAASLLEKRSDELARMMAREMGKPLAQGRSEAEKCAWACRFYVEHAEGFLQPMEAESDGSEARVRFDPIGPVLAVMPWNFPFWQVFRFAAPNLAAGNVGLLKHAGSTPQCAQAIETLLADAGAPEGVFQNLYVSNEQTAELIAHDEVRGVTLTGSTNAGQVVAKNAGAALKPMVMELGGSDPFLVFPDADLEEAVEQAVTARCLNSGQSCIAAKRFLVHSAVSDRFVDAFVHGMKARKVGDPMDKENDIGPLAREDLRDGIQDQVDKALLERATVLCGGETPDRKGYFYPPTVIVGLDPESDIAREEFFGPVATVFTFRDEDEAVRLANGTPFGLGASLWTQNRDRMERLIPRIESGSVFVNGFVKSDPRLPFGGVKESGFGRELARDGMLEFTNRKTVWIA